jgi:diacylglycerol kinase (ATP)
MNFKKAFKSFRFAIKGLKWLVAFENNFQIHLLASILAIAAGFLLKINQTEWLFVLLMIGLVWAAEAFNTAIEQLCDFIEPKQDTRIGRVKDLAAAAVFILSMIAFTTGILIFVPKILNF